MRQLQLNSRDVLVVDVPEGAHTISVALDGYELHMIVRSKLTRWGCFFKRIPIPEGNWKLLGRLSEITEEVAKVIVAHVDKTETVDYSSGGGGRISYTLYKNYENGEYEFDTALESLFSWARVNGIRENEVLLIKNENHVTQRS